MAYEVVNLSVKDFISDTSIKLPRFQRKSTWTLVQDFNLCISMFKGYPLGVVIYNNTTDAASKNVNYLLDGRQRRNALKTCIESPIAMYMAATKALNLKSSMSLDEVAKKFWTNVSGFFRKVDDSDDSSEESSGGGDEIDSMIESMQKNTNLKLLLDFIKAMHGPVSQGVTPWEKRWDFQKYFDYLIYVDKKTKKINPKKLKDFIVGHFSEVDLSGMAVDSFIASFEDFAFSDGGETGMKVKVAKVFDSLKEDIRVLTEINTNVFGDAKLGVIKITNATTLDSQMIFSLVNRGGTQLKSEELLSAKPFWNIQIPGDMISGAIKTKIQELYSKMGIPGENFAHGGNYVNWDVCATFLDRFDKGHLLFPDYDGVKESDKVLLRKVIEGFKLVATNLCGGFSASSMEKLETHSRLVVEIDSLGEDLATMTLELMKHPFFQRLHAWGKSVDDLIGMAATFEFVSVLRIRWSDLGCASGSNLKKFAHESLALFDRLVHEYTIGYWRGSSDSKLAEHLKDHNYLDRVVPVSETEWIALVEKACGETNEHYKNKEALIRYFLVLQKKQPDPTGNTLYDIDHIIPQKAIDAAAEGTIKKTLKNSLGNMALFPRPRNQAKKDKKLVDMPSDLKKEVAKYADVAEEDFEKYSAVTNLEALVEERKAMYLALLSRRVSLFAD